MRQSKTEFSCCCSHINKKKLSFDQYWRSKLTDVEIGTNRQIRIQLIQINTGLNMDKRNSLNLSIFKIVSLNVLYSILHHISLPFFPSPSSLKNSFYLSPYSLYPNCVIILLDPDGSNSL